MWTVGWQTWWFVRFSCDYEISNFTEGPMVNNLYYVWLWQFPDVYLRSTCMSFWDCIKIEGGREGTISKFRSLDMEWLYMQYMQIFNSSKFIFAVLNLLKWGAYTIFEIVTSIPNWIKYWIKIIKTIFLTSNIFTNDIIINIH